MELDPKRQYSIGEVSEITGVPPYLLRQWEEKFPQLRPRRSRSNRRTYSVQDIEIVRRVKHLLRHEKMTPKGAKIRLAQELHGEGRPKTRQETIDLLDKLEDEVRAVLHLLDSLE